MFYCVRVDDNCDYKDFQQTEWMLQYKAKGKLGSPTVMEQKISCLLVNSIHSSAFSQLFLHHLEFIETCWHNFKSTGILAIKIKLKNTLFFDQWNVTGRWVVPTNLNSSVSHTLALPDQSNWTYLKKKSFICCKKKLIMYKQTLGFGRLFPLLILTISPITIQPNHST